MSGASKSKRKRLNKASTERVTTVSDDEGEGGRGEETRKGDMRSSTLPKASSGGRESGSKPRFKPAWEGEKTT